jgi:hypothetical protein
MYCMAISSRPEKLAENSSILDAANIQGRLAANPEKAHTRDDPRISTTSGMPNAMAAAAPTANIPSGGQISQIELRDFLARGYGPEQQALLQNNWNARRIRYR